MRFRALAGRFGLSGDAQHDLNVFPGGEVLQPGDKLVQLLRRLVPRQLKEIVDKDMRNIVIAGVQAADKAFQ